MTDPDLDHGDAPRELVIFAGEEPVARLQQIEGPEYDRVVARSLRAFADALDEEAPDDAIDPDECVYDLDDDL